MGHCSTTRQHLVGNLRSLLSRGGGGQSRPRRAAAMLPLLYVLVLSHAAAHVTHTPIHLDRLHRIYEKLELVHAPTTQQPHTTTETKTEKPSWKRKLEELEALTPVSFYLSQEDEELLKTMQAWGQLSPEQVDGMAKDLLRSRQDKEERNFPAIRQNLDQDLASDYDEDEYPADADYEYRSDGKDDEDDEELEVSSEPPFRPPPGVTPAAFTRDGPRQGLSAVEPMAATNERPLVTEEADLPPAVRATLRQEIMAHIRYVMSNNKCVDPQPQWLIVRQMAPAADILYVPPSVRLHRCVPDSGCCNNDSEVCAPVQGENVTLPFYLKKPSTVTPAQITFYNHTKCACVPRDTLRVGAVRRPRPREGRRGELRLDRPLDRRPDRDERREDRQNDWHPPSEPPSVDEDATSPPLMSRRCTCPAPFLASMGESGPCACVCEWADAARRRVCLSFARGEEHFGLRDRFCVSTGDCAPPTCRHGPYDTGVGRCPFRGNRYRRLRYQRRFQPEKALVV